jgi:CheY-like chemotaxis protein
MLGIVIAKSILCLNMTISDLRPSTITMSHFVREGAKMTDDLMTVLDLADYLKIEPRVLCRYLQAHPLARKDTQLPAVRVEGQWRFRKEDIDRWLGQHPVLRPPTSRQHRILVVDDDENFRTLLIDLLETSGYVVQGAENARRALDMMEEAAFDLLMVDLRLPAMGGIELIRQAKSLQPTARVMIVSGYVSEEWAAEAARLGVTHTVEKPIRDLRVFESTIRLVLSRETLQSADGRSVSVAISAGRNGNGSYHTDSFLQPLSMANGATVPSEATEDSFIVSSNDSHFRIAAGERS